MSFLLGHVSGSFTVSKLLNPLEPLSLPKSFTGKGGLHVYRRVMKQYESIETIGLVTLKRQMPREDHRPPSWSCELLKLSPPCTQESTPSQCMLLSGLSSGFVRDWCLGVCLLLPVAESAGSSSHHCTLCLCSHCSFALISSLSPLQSHQTH